MAGVRSCGLSGMVVGVWLRWNRMAKLNLKPSAEKEKVSTKGTWGVLVVDDDQEIHAMTRLVMKDWVFSGRGMKIYSADSSEAARKLLQEEPEIALILLDVVMENDHSGLDLVRYIREILKNNLIRIILRTGQPGKAPLRRVIRDFEINDYKEKNELTADRLFVTVTAALRSYEDLVTIERNRLGLEKVLNATSKLFENYSLSSFADGILVQIAGLVRAGESSLFLQFDSLTMQHAYEESVILAGTGRFKQYINCRLDELDEPEIRNLVDDCLKDRQSFFRDDSYVGFFPVSDNVQNLLIFQGISQISDFKQQLIRIFSANASMAFSNLYLNKEIEETQKEVICTLGEVVESRSRETARHIRRVSETALLLGKGLNLPEEDLRNLQMAAPMHDVGKIGIPDEILHKPGRLDSREFEIMKTHTLIGYEILKNSSRKVMQTAAIIALEHHERWDGNGYPMGKKGGDIHIMGRIISIVDVFDALYNRRIYKDPWPLDKILELFREERGGHFDPQLVDILTDRIDEIVRIQKDNRDNNNQAEV